MSQPISLNQIRYTPFSLQVASVYLPYTLHHSGSVYNMKLNCVQQKSPIKCFFLLGSLFLLFDTTTIAQNNLKSARVKRVNTGDEFALPFICPSCCPVDSFLTKHNDNQCLSLCKCPAQFTWRQDMGQCVKSSGTSSYT